MENSNLRYPEEVLHFMASRIPENMLEVFRMIVRNAPEGGITWTELVNKTQDRYMVEKALFYFEANGFIILQQHLPSVTDRRQKRYMPDEVRGLQLVYYLQNQKKKTST